MDGNGLVPWYVIKTKPLAERLVIEGLSDLGFSTYLPMIPDRRRDPRHSTREAPLFPGYLFVQLDLKSPDWVRARSYPGTSYILSQDGRPIPLPMDAIEAIQGRVQQIRARVEAGLAAFLHSGDLVRILDGPFADLEAVFYRPLSGRERCQVLLKVMQQLAIVTLSYNDLDPARIQSIA